MCMTHGYTRHFLFLSLTLVAGAVSVAACDAMTGDPVEERLYDDGECKYDCEEEPPCKYGDYGCEEEPPCEYGDYGCEEEPSCEYGEYGCEEEDKGCTLTQGYWKNHNIQAKNMNQKLPWPEIYAGKVTEYTKLPTKDGKTWLEILHTPPKGNPWYIAAHQWIAAKLNIKANGNTAPLEVLFAVSTLESYLNGKQNKVCDGKANALKLAKLLDDYNNGKVGPPHCGDQENAAKIETYDYEADICDGKGKVGQDNYGLKEK
jgi:hypothetical protein